MVSWCRWHYLYIIMIITAIIIIIIFINVFEFISACWLSPHHNLSVCNQHLSVWKTNKMNSHIFVQWCRNRKRSIELLLFCLITLIYTLFSLVGFVCVSSSSCFFIHFRVVILITTTMRITMIRTTRMTMTMRILTTTTFQFFECLSHFNSLPFWRFDNTMPNNKNKNKNKNININIINETKYTTNTFAATRKIEHVLNIIHKYRHCRAKVWGQCEILISNETVHWNKEYTIQPSPKDFEWNVYRFVKTQYFAPSSYFGMVLYIHTYKYKYKYIYTNMNLDN